MSDARRADWRRSGRFFALTFALAMPFWILGATVGVSILPGLPIAALDFICPGLAALILLGHVSGIGSALVLLGRALDPRRVRARVWYLPALLLMPLIIAVAFGVTRLTGVAIPAPHIAPVHALLLCALLFGAALGEELGWSGYATDRLQQRWNALQTGLLLGSVWAIYHYVALLQAHRSIGWIAWWTLGTLAARIIITWLYNNANQSVLIATLFHMTINVTWQLYPVNGSHYDPRTTGLITAIVAGAIVLTTGPGTLIRVTRRSPTRTA